MLQFAALLFFTLFLPIRAYIPATPTNSTGDDGPNFIPDGSIIVLQWHSNGSYTENISHPIAGKDSTGISKGALIHFSEEDINNSTAPTSAPWIALIACEKNATNASFSTDIFGLARDKGAVSALLYSLYSQTCIINPEYSANSEHVFDIFLIPRLTSSHIIEYQFSQIGHGISSYDSAQLNNSASAIVDSNNAGYPVSTGFLLAALTAPNATANKTTPATTQPSTKSGSNPRSIPFLMMVLYPAMTCVLALLQ